MLKCLTGLQPWLQTIQLLLKFTIMKQHFFIRDKSIVYKINFDDIILIEGTLNYCKIHTANNQFTTLSTLKHILETLPPDDFIRVHKSFIVSVKYINKISRSQVCFESQKCVPIGDTYRENITTLIEGNMLN